MIKGETLPVSLENRLLGEILEERRMSKEEIEARYKIGEEAAERLLLRRDLTDERRMVLGEESPIVEKATEDLLKAAETKIKEDFHDDSGYKDRLFHEIALLKEDAYVRGHREILMGLYLAYELKRANPYEFIGDAWLTGDSLLAFLLDLTPFNPIANDVPLEYFEELLNHGDYIPRLVLRKQFLKEKGLGIGSFFALDETNDRREIWEIRSALLRASPLWLHFKASTSSFGQIAQIQLDHLDSQYLCKTPLDEGFVLLFHRQCEPYFQNEKRTGWEKFPTTRERLFSLLYERSNDAPYAYEMSRALAKDKTGYWAERCSELSKEEREFYQKTSFIQPLPYCFERAFEEYSANVLKKVK
jgi:hypothetical protein